MLAYSLAHPMSLSPRLTNFTVNLSFQCRVPAVCTAYLKLEKSRHIAQLRVSSAAVVGLLADGHAGNLL